MKAMAWLVGGFVLLGLSGMIEAVGDTGMTPEARLPIYITALAVLLGAPFCFFKAFRSLIAANPRGKPTPEAPRPARRMTEQADTEQAEIADTDQFDADAAFARYMEKRARQTAEPQPADVQPISPPTARPAFGRRRV